MLFINKYVEFLPVNINHNDLKSKANIVWNLLFIFIAVKKNSNNNRTLTIAPR